MKLLQISLFHVDESWQKLTSVTVTLAAVYYFGHLKCLCAYH